MENLKKDGRWNWFCIQRLLLKSIFTLSSIYAIYAIISLENVNPILLSIIPGIAFSLVIATQRVEPNKDGIIEDGLFSTIVIEKDVVEKDFKYHPQVFIINLTEKIEKKFGKWIAIIFMILTLFTILYSINFGFNVIENHLESQLSLKPHLKQG